MISSVNGLICTCIPFIRSEVDGVLDWAILGRAVLNTTFPCLHALTLALCPGGKRAIQTVFNWCGRRSLLSEALYKGWQNWVVVRSGLLISRQTTDPETEAVNMSQGEGSGQVFLLAGPPKHCLLAKVVGILAPHAH